MERNLRGGILLAVVAVGFGPAAAQGREPVFERDVLPLLTARCLKCHGGDAHKSGLDLRSPASMLKGGDSGPAVVKGDADKSLLIQQVASKTMPPGKATKLTEDEVARLPPLDQRRAPGCPGPSLARWTPLVVPASTAARSTAGETDGPGPHAD